MRRYPIPPEEVDVCHLTVLNPALHSRIWYKQAVTLAQYGWRVHVVGTRGGGPPARHPQRATFTELPVLRAGNTWHRVGRQMGLLREAIRLRARCYTIHTPELLPLAVALRHQCGAHIVYDVHEDYTANAAQRWGTRHWLPEYLRQWQQEALPLLSGVTYAEALYNDVLQARGVVPQVAVVQNAFRPPEQLVTPQPPGELPRLLFTGTLSESWGVFTALDVWHALWNLGLHTELLLVGYSPASGVLRQLEQRIAALQPLPVRLVGGAAYVPHHNVLQYIAGCDAGFALYHPQPNLRGKVPTKFWEYGYYGKPLLYTDVPEWRAYHQSNGLGFAVPVQPSAEDIQQLHHQLRLQFSIPSGQQPAFRQTGYDAWTNNEAPRLLALYRALLGAPKAS